jgi:hypothetical protein
MTVDEEHMLRGLRALVEAETPSGDLQALQRGFGVLAELVVEHTGRTPQVGTGRDGVPYLMVRMANWRRNQVVEAKLRVTLLRSHRSEEGDLMRVQTDLPLVRDHTHMFALTWTAMHRIDADSPLYGPYPRERLAEAQTQILLSFHGLDATMGQTIHASATYSIDDVVWNARYADVLHADGPIRHLDYRYFHEVVPQDLPPLDDALSRMVAIAPPAS